MGSSVPGRPCRALPPSSVVVSGARLEEEKSGLVLPLDFPKRRRTGAPKTQEKEPKPEPFPAWLFSGPTPHAEESGSGEGSAPERVVLREQLISPGLISFANALGLRNRLNSPGVNRLGGCWLLITLRLSQEESQGVAAEGVGAWLPSEAEASLCPSCTALRKNSPKLAPNKWPS